MPDSSANRAAHLEADVLVIGAGAAGMYAAIEAARRGAGRVLLLDRSLIGRGGATVMAQMTVAAAVGPDGEDHWRHHLADTLAAGRGLCDPGLAALLCEAGVGCVGILWGYGDAAELAEAEWLAATPGELLALLGVDGVESRRDGGQSR